MSHRDPALLGGLYLLPLLLYLILGVSFLAAGFISLFRIRFFFLWPVTFVNNLLFCLPLSGDWWPFSCSPICHLQECDQGAGGSRKDRQVGEVDGEDRLSSLQCWQCCESCGNFDRIDNAESFDKVCNVDNVDNVNNVDRVDNVKSTQVKIGIFSVLYIVPAGTVIACSLYEAASLARCLPPVFVLNLQSISLFALILYFIYHAFSFCWPTVSLSWERSLLCPDCPTNSSKPDFSVWIRFWRYSSESLFNFVFSFSSMLYFRFWCSSTSWSWPSASPPAFGCGVDRLDDDWTSLLVDQHILSIVICNNCLHCIPSSPLSISDFSVQFWFEVKNGA